MRLLMALYLGMVASEKKPKKRRWWKSKRESIRGLLEFVDGLPQSDRKLTASGPTTTPPATESSHVPILEWTPVSPSEPQHKRVVEAIPTTLVEREAACAVTLQMPNRTTRQGIRAYGNARFDTPIGRTLTREFIRRDPSHTPKAAIRHLPIMDGVRAMAVHGNVGPQPTLPPAERKKGRPTPKRNRSKHGTQQ